MFDVYKDIFDKRGAAYHKAMLDYPLAREAEFRHILGLADIQEGDVVCDVPSGGGYLGGFIERQVEIISIDASTEFIRHCQQIHNMKKIQCDLSAITLPSSSVDKIISLAGLHHTKDLKPFYKEACRILNTNGLFCIADVVAGSGVADFLNGFVHEYSSMGHQGYFLSKKTRIDLEDSGFQVTYESPVQYFWKFTGMEDMIRCCKLMFGIDQANNEQILEGISKYLGYQKIDASYCMNWSLLFIRTQKI